MKAFAALFSMAVLFSPALAQTPRGSLRGAIVDATGARVASAQVMLQTMDSSLRRTLETGARGEFRADDLPPGQYEMSVTATGFAQAQAEVSVDLSSVREVTVTLHAVGSSESVNVQGQG